MAHQVVIKFWKPRTKLGRSVKSKTIKNLDEFFSQPLRTKEPEIIDFLIACDYEVLKIIPHNAGRGLRHEACVSVGKKVRACQGFKIL